MIKHCGQSENKTFHLVSNYTINGHYFYDTYKLRSFKCGHVHGVGETVLIGECIFVSDAYKTNFTYFAPNENMFHCKQSRYV